jgi:hypothetical protein
MPVLTKETQMELPIAVLLKRRAAAAAAARYPRVRGDTLPEKTRYRDDGCEIHPHCLTCPLPRCVYEEPGGLKGTLMALRDREIVTLKDRGIPIEEIADRFGVSRRTVFRILTTKYKEARCA